MNINLITIKKTRPVKAGLFLSLFSFLLPALSVNAQTYVTGPVSGTITSGEYIHNSSITIVPNTVISPGAGQSVHFYIPGDCAPLPAINYASQNYILTSIPRTPISSNAGLAGRLTCELMQMVQYVDGLGRPLQTVQVKGSPGNNDVVQPIAYDQFGRETTKYLPYAATTADGSYKADALSTGLMNFYYPSAAASGSQQSSGVVYNPKPYSVINFEPSPLNRVVEQGAPGPDWQPVAGSTAGHTVKIDYTTNDASSFIATLYTVTVNSDQSRTLTVGNSSGSTYAAGQLYVTISKDENWTSGKPGTTEEYKDKEGHVVLKRTFNQVGPTTQILSTYYVYDDLGNLAFVLPPGASPDAGISSAANQATLNSMCYQYQYDERNRLSGKRLPGKDWEYIIYNKLDQPVLTQDGVQRGKSPQEWTFTKYDALGRVIMTGLFKNTTALSRADLQANIYAAAQYDARNYSVTPSPYVLSSYPTTLSWVFVINYYDDYTYPGNPYNPTVSETMARPTGLLTASRAAVLNPDGTFGAMLWSVIYYDDKGRQAEVDKQHYLGGSASLSNSNYDNTTFTYNFNDQVTQSIRHHYTSANTGAPAVVIGTAYAYDHMGRQTETREAISNGNTPAPVPTLLSSLTYNEIGQLKTKGLHNNSQSINYSYNERGWLSKINDPAIAPTAGQLFSQQLNYNTPQYGATAQYNGNIADQSYRVYNSNSPTPGIQNVTYSYDNLNRLTAGNSSTGYSETMISYDLMGNIGSLIRGGTKSASLAYIYQGNQLSSVSNGGPGFRSYGYDANGNATSDGMGHTINYNLLNLPADIPGKSLTYTYDATGQKLRKIAGGVVTEYISGIQYNGTAIDFIQTGEGRAIKSGSTYNYEYTLSDHLGNNRVTFDQTSGKVGEDDYYPFGLNVHQGPIVSPENNYLYNKKEIQKELNDQYDYGARFYDPVIARWTSVDPLADEFDRLSPYNYASNNPILMIDPDGMAADSTNKPKPEPKPIELKEVTVTAKRIYHLNHDVKPIIAEFPLYIGVRGAVTTIPRVVELVRDIDMLSSLLRLQNMMSQHTVDANDKSDDNDLPEGFNETKEFGKQHGQKVYKKGNKYYSKDVDGHNGGAWKVFEKQGSKLKRVGTADKNLNVFKK
jgi:RHS repeat-associated protein